MTANLVLAVVLALISSVAYAAGAVAQRRLAGSPAPPGPSRGGGWLLAVGLNGGGAALHVLALRYGPLSLVQPLGALTLVLALPAGAALSRRRLAAADWHGMILTMAGLTGLLLLTRTTGAAHAIPASTMAGIVALTAFALAALAVAGNAVRHPAGRSLLYATASGVAFGVASALTQTIAVRIADGVLLDAGVMGGLTAIAALAAAGLFLSQAAYRGGLGAQLATSTLVNAATAGAIGLLVLGEQYAAGSTGAVLAVAAAALAARGVLMLSQAAETDGSRVTATTGATAPAGTPAPRARADAPPR